MQLSEKDRSILTQVAFKAAVENGTARGANLSNPEHQTSFALAYTFLKDFLFAEVQGDTPQPEPQYAPQTAAPAPAASNDYGAAQEAVEKAFPGTTEAPNGGLTVLNQTGPIPHWLFEACANDGTTEVHDNRDKATKENRQPWFRDTSGRKNAKGRDYAYWQPKS